MKQLQETVSQLLEALQQQDEIRSTTLLNELTGLQEHRLYQEISGLGNRLHQALNELGNDDLLMQTKHDIPDVTERLHYVLNSIEEASQLTLDQAEQGLEVITRVSQELPEGNDLNQLRSIFNQIILAQSYQDLTGQVVHKVIHIIGELEGSLHQLIEKAGHDLQDLPERLDNRENLLAGVGPQIKADKSESVRHQDDVDDLLKDLGL
ncbi:protein phosphatase CheZ [Thiomicrorhabdus heinhorstiae]|uniref:Protein phosphatase CheZ n=1 Tax=Thiomicrorhabdus heinhorstiae TaxID=2748010 RepID=A0ABS0BY72_9GAMM|nr:protein phosphatase CheZ [Thiomicrorhabdus heinhorstiae]MBF6058359.1 protein phosphatase CheZ [Thiomicrorhabdus heinhorstiae]